MWRPVESIARRLAVRKAVLGLLTVNELFWRALVESLTLPIISFLTLEEVLSAGAVGWLFAWCFYFALIFITFGLHPPFPEAVREITTSRWFRAITATNAIGIALAMESRLWPDRELAPSVLPVVPDGVFNIFILTMSIVLLGSLGYNRGSTLVDPDSFFVAYANPFVPKQNLPTELQKHREDRGRDLKYWSVIGMTGVVTLVTWNLVCWFVGVGTLAVGLLYPLPEVLVLAWVVQGVLFDSRDREYLGQRTSRLAVDLNDRIVLAAESATRSMKGAVSVLMVLFGLMLPILAFTIGLGTLATRVNLSRAAAVYELRHWVFAGFVFGSTLLFGLYGVWYWLRELARVPHFLDDREHAAESSANDRLPLVTRPPGYFGAPMALLLLVVVGVSRASAIESARLPLWLILVWVGVVSVLAWTVWAAITSPPQPPATENVALPLSFAVYGAGSLLLTVATTKISTLWEVIVGPDPIRGLLAAFVAETPVEMLVFLAGFLGLFYYTDVVLWYEKLS